MKADFATVKRQFETARKALDRARGSGVIPLQKVYDEAKANYLGHPEHPNNKGKPVEPVKRF